MTELITITNNMATLNEETSLLIAELERQAKEIKNLEDELNAEILKEMEKRGITKIETPELSIIYVYPYEKEVFDTKKFREENPVIYDGYCKFTEVRSSIRIKAKS